MLIAFSVAPSGTGREDGSVHDAVAVDDPGLVYRQTREPVPFPSQVDG